MKEFIVWDKNDNRFLDSLFVNCELNEAVSNNEDFEIFQYIGKADIKGNKIYADSSVVEMTIRDEDGKHTHIGFFNYNSFLLCYDFREPYKNGEMSGNRIWRMEKLQIYSVQFKIIDTIQENKLGLIK